MLAEVLATLAALALLLASFVAHPNRATCPPGWFVGSVQPTGFYACARIMDNDADDRRPGVRPGWIYCTGGSRAVINVDGVTVGCSR